MRQCSDYAPLNQLLIKAPKGFTYDVIIPTQASILRNNLPLSEVTLGGAGETSCFSSDNEKDLESTEESQNNKLSSLLFSSQDDQDELMQCETENQKSAQTKASSKKTLTINGIQIDNYLASDDLNECVDFLLRKQKIVPNQSITRIIRHNASGKSKDKRHRQRKNVDQHHILLNYFEKDPNWDK